MIIMPNKTPPKVIVTFDPEPVREKTGLSKRLFAAHVGISENGYTSLSNNPLQVRLKTVSKIISATGCSITDLYRVEPLA